MSMAKDSDAQWDICPSPNQICLHFFTTYYWLKTVCFCLLKIDVFMLFSILTLVV